jgi:hypothetical protein
MKRNFFKVFKLLQNFSKLEFLAGLANFLEKRFFRIEFEVIKMAVVEISDILALLLEYLEFF